MSELKTPFSFVYIYIIFILLLRECGNYLSRECFAFAGLFASRTYSVVFVVQYVLEIGCDITIMFFE